LTAICHFDRLTSHEISSLSRPKDQKYKPVSIVSLSSDAMIALTNLLHIFPAVIIENGSALFSYALIRLFVWEHLLAAGIFAPGAAV
jgi:hypothetical protein